MIGIFKVADNPFDSVLISNDRLSTFASDAATRLRSTHPALADAIDGPQRTFSALLGKISVNNAVKQTGTEGLDVFLAELARYMTEAEAQVTVSLGRNSGAYQAIYPNKKQTYTRLTKTEAPARLDALKKVVEESGASLPADMRTRMAGFRAAWDDARASQNAAEGELSGSRSDRDTARATLEDALFVALLDLSKEFRKEPARLKNYFDHTLLDAPRHASLEHNDAAPVVSASE
ncbi:hypothetical protein EPD60_07735 [Flaviaesturariibacter flavus]|uniref:Uncharacterized protein n=1 Tax=Flaviaesturariibacter flavus TaxID=2502780 RepID=A0A4R1BFB1_9BACT|nr:hypothetical protein [Flaviaesturariibacter flavus]TCJ15841.1 hypothetical protein EPD60_07735 [Flaviaesturariibacter flavus]